MYNLSVFRGYLVNFFVLENRKIFFKSWLVYLGLIRELVVVLVLFLEMFGLRFCLYIKLSYVWLIE